MAYNVRNQTIEDTLKDLGDLIMERLPNDWGFTLLLFDYEKAGDCSLFYMSSAEREGMITAMKEFIKLNEH